MDYRPTIPEQRLLPTYRDALEQGEILDILADKAKAGELDAGIVNDLITQHEVVWKALQDSARNTTPYRGP